MKYFVRINVFAHSPWDNLSCLWLKWNLDLQKINMHLKLRVLFDRRRLKYFLEKNWIPNIRYESFFFINLMVDTKLDYSVIKYSFKWYSFFLFFQVHSHFLNQISLASLISEKDNIYRLLIPCSLSSLIAQFTIIAKQTARKRHHLQKQRPLWHLKCIPWTRWVCFVLGICPAKTWRRLIICH